MSENALFLDDAAMQLRRASEAMSRLGTGAVTPSFPFSLLGADSRTPDF